MTGLAVLLLSLCFPCQTVMAGSPKDALESPEQGTHKFRKPKISESMVLIPESTFWRGSAQAELQDAQPQHKVHLRSFWIDKTEVTNKDFARFVKETGYITVAERKPEAKEFPGLAPENLVAGALVFTPAKTIVSKSNPYSWWRYVPGASWQHPEGPQSTLKGRWKHPVVQVAYEDAQRYAEWAGKRLPTEAEFECAARGGLDRKKFTWGDEFKPGGNWQCNIWQGRFPYENTAEDGFSGTAPVGSFPANAYGLFDMTGNVWEWCSDWYDSNYYRSFPADSIVENPAGPEKSFDPAEPNALKKVQSGGSFLCTDQYCTRYLAGARGKGEIATGCSHVGFRCARDAK